MHSKNKKKLFFGVLLIISIVCVCVCVIAIKRHTYGPMEKLMLANLEALTYDEVNIPKDCYKDGTPPYGPYGGYVPCNKCHKNTWYTYGWLGNPCDRP